MKKFNDLKKGDILKRDKDALTLYIVDDKTNNWAYLTFIRVYDGGVEIGDGIVFDAQTWLKNEFNKIFSNMPLNIENSLQYKIITGIMGEIEWT